MPKHSPFEDQEPKLRCRLFGHLWTKAPIHPLNGRPVSGAWTAGGNNPWPYCRRCLTPKRKGVRGHSGDKTGWVPGGDRISYRNENL